MITQTVNTLEEVVPYTPNYFEDIAVRNNALVTTVFPQINVVVGQINAELAVMNGYATSTSTAAANALAYSNNAATSAAAATAAANRAQSVVIPTSAAYAIATQDWRDTMMSKAEFNAVAAERRANRAGSGADNFGKGNATTALNVNEGIHTSTTTPNTFYLGKVAGTGASLTDAYIASINGSVILAKYLNTTTADATLLLPPAPTILPSTATLTQQQIDSGVIKHADASNSGLLLNGKFDTDTSGWTTANGATISVDTGRLKVTNSATANGYAYQSFSTIIGKVYKVELEYTDDTGAGRVFIGTTSGGSTIYAGATFTASNNGRNVIEFTATTTTTFINLFNYITIDTSFVFFDNIAVFPADAISRSDLPFIESWHEDVSEKDFVYPLGNILYLGTTGDCGTTVAGAFAGAVTYSLFSDTWQADSALIGKGYVWSTLSDANKKAFVANPENNCYLDGDKVIQVRYRMRVVQGRTDNFINTDPQNPSSTASVGWLRDSDYIFAKGKSPTVFTTTTYGFQNVISSAVSSFSSVGSFVTSLQSTVSYDSKCFALPIALVHRRNQGMKHDTYNPNGTKLASDGLNQWLTSVSFTSTADCFTDSKLLTASGYIGTTTGRADGIFYDQVHEGDITDLRMSSRVPTDYNRLIDKEFNRLVSGTYRGTEGEIYANSINVIATTFTARPLSATSIALYAGAQGSTLPILPTEAYGLIGYSVYLTTIAGSEYGYISSVASDSIIVTRLTNTAFGTIVANVNTPYNIIVGRKSTRTKSNTLTHTDIIGSPANYPTAWKQSGVSGVPLIVAEDGTSLLPTGTTGSDGLAVYKLSRKANATPLQVLKSTDSGVTWTALTVTTHYTFSTTTNAITFTTGNIPLVADLIRVTYQTHTNMCTATTNQAPIAIGEAIATNGVAHGHLVSSLIGKVPTASTAPYAQFGYDTYGYRIDATTLKFSTTSTEFPLHIAFTLAGGASGVATVKTFPYLTSSNGKAYVNIPFKEMKHNGTSYGDDGKFFMTDNVTTTTDNNALTVLTGTKRIELPYFIGAAE